jgi:HlyD family secretion protein
MKPVAKWGVGVALVVAVTATALLVGTRGTEVQVVPVVRARIVQSVVATGRFNAPARIDIGSEVTAVVQEVRVREGDRVQAGELMIQLSDGEARAALLQAQAALTEARNRVEQQASVAAPMASQAVAQAQASFDAAEREYQRARDLVARGFYSRQRLDEARRQRDTTRSMLEAASVQARANEDSGVEQALALSRVEQAAAALEVAQARLERLRIVSPVDAIVLARHAEPGSMAQPGRVLLALAAQGEMRIDAGIDEKHLGLLKHGMPARAVADAFPGLPFDAKLTYLAPAVDPQRGTVEVRLAVPQAPDFLRPDMTVSVELLGGEKPDALVLPAGAVRDADRAAPWVLALRNGRAVRTPVTLGLRGVGAVEIVAGLEEGDEAIPQTEKALDGDRVRRSGASARGRGFEVPSFISG